MVSLKIICSLINQIFNFLFQHCKKVEKTFFQPPGVNFINILCTAFTLVDTKTVKKIQLSHKYIFTLSGSASVNAVCRTLMKLSPGFPNFV